MTIYCNDFFNQLLQFHTLSSKMRHSISHILKEPNQLCCVGLLVCLWTWSKHNKPQ